ncbi:C-type lectin domain family 2 member G-like protein [Cricetulus griseus]|uniref:C-type lectin domain family 2 member G-like protein n=1 Tax=Cricetulus griseus TaxID=10029 RepID=A0A061HWF1_CRIGR|nr:C-type lectin domain family 2 member G-like protein [Cricetulus griseus]
MLRHIAAIQCTPQVPLLHRNLLFLTPPPTPTPATGLFIYSSHLYLAFCSSGKAVFINSTSDTLLARF